MARLQLALNVTDLDAAVEFYGDLFDAQPHKRRPGYANFAIDNPPLKLILFEAAAEGAEGGTLNHLGVEVEAADEVTAAAERLRAAGREVDTRVQETCCHAVMDKVWTAGPDAERWEYYIITDDNPVNTIDDPCGDGGCAFDVGATTQQPAEGLPVACC